MRYLLIFFLFLSPIFLLGQKGPIEVTSIQEQHEVIINAKNKSSQNRMVDLTIRSKGLGFKEDKVLSKMIPAKSTLELIRLRPEPGKKVSLTYEFSQRIAAKIATSETASDPTTVAKGAAKTTDTNSANNNGIKVYHKAGCSRCDLAVNYLKENNVPFTKLDITKNKKNHSEMGNLLMGAGFPGGSFQTPVITVGDEVHYNIKDLRNFLANLKPAAVTEKQATAAEDIESSEASGAEKRINVYHKQGCHRCEIVVKYLKANNIAYQKLDITKNEKNAEEMWALLRADGHKKGTIQTPVITVGDQLHYNIKDLTGFLEGLKR